jgi:hypothetical protein
MTARRSASGLVMLVGATLLIAACGPAANATTAPTATPTTPAVTDVPASEAPSSGLPAFSFALPSFTSDAALEAMFPKDLGGEALHVLSMRGTDFMGSGASGNEIGPVLQQLGKTPADLSVAFAGTSNISVFAFQIHGIAADQFLNAYLQGAQSAQGSTITDASFGGKSVKKVVVSGQDATYLYLHNDVVWTVGGTGITDALLNEAFSKLP